ncbi:MAG: hypothetical protein IKQ31_02205 [Clostridia bacterium]|nr:hypothetical protein [Clostridia bacterium]
MKGIRDSYIYKNGELTILDNQPSSERMAFYERLFNSLERNEKIDPAVDIKEVVIKNVSSLGLVDLHLEIFEKVEKITFGEGILSVPGGLFDLSYMGEGVGEAFSSLHEIDFGNVYTFDNVLNGLNLKTIKKITINSHPILNSNNPSYRRTQLDLSECENLDELVITNGAMPFETENTHVEPIQIMLPANSIKSHKWDVENLTVEDGAKVVVVNSDPRIAIKNVRVGKGACLEGQKSCLCINRLLLNKGNIKHCFVYTAEVEQEQASMWIGRQICAKYGLSHRAKREVESYIENLNLVDECHTLYECEKLNGKDIQNAFDTRRVNVKLKLDKPDLCGDVKKRVDIIFREREESKSEANEWLKMLCKLMNNFEWMVDSSVFKNYQKANPVNVDNIELDKFLEPINLARSVVTLPREKLK